MTKKVKRKSIIGLFLAAVLLISSSLSASAIAYSDWTTSPKLYGYTYQYRAGLFTMSGNALAMAMVQTTDGSSAPAGYMGANAFLFRKGGDLAASSGMIYTNESTPSCCARVSIQESGTFYARGLVSLCTGKSNGVPTYKTYNTTQTTYGTSSQSATGYSVNSNGETYGSGLMADVYGELPDLIKAEGTNGISGYVRYEDLVYTPKSTEDAVAYSVSLEAGVYIPVYDLDGDVVDVFILRNYNTDTAISEDLTAN